jgi:2,4-dienoyl-CoA reductase-like NADH-dependent reductase (Old Yellow Enzyme family)/thioredoxin reductase
MPFGWKRGDEMKTFEAVRIGKLALANRLLMAPVKTGFAGPDGLVTEQLLAYYRRRAEGGVGAIIVEPLFVDAGGKEHPRQLAIDTQETVEGLRRLADTIHDGGAKAVAHLNHGGRASNPKVIGQPPEAPSEVACPTTGAVPRILRKTRIHELVKSFAASARRAHEAGFDAVEIQCGLGYLISQFLSQRTNQRTDEYGGDQERRDRFAHEVVDAVRDALNGTIPIIARISASEQIDGGLALDDAQRFARRLVDWGVSAIHVVTGSACDTPPWYYQHMSLPNGVNENFAAQIKPEIGVPTIVAGRLGDPDRIEQVIGGGLADMVALGRPLVADPDLPRKMAEGRTDEIVLCGSCLQGCLANVKAGKGLGCIVNPEVGNESHIERPAEKERHVVIVGGGPAGLTAAIVARRRGHRVTLLERDELGGQFTLAPLAPGKAAMTRPLTSLIQLASSSGATIRTETEATVKSVVSLDPDVVVLATGASPAKIPVTGLDCAFTGDQVLKEEVDTGKSVLIVGGGMVGIEVAEFLAVQGKTVTVIEILDEIAHDMFPITRKLTLKRLKDLPVEILTETVLESVDGGQAVVRGPAGVRHLGPFDSVVVAVGTKSNCELATPLLAQGLDVHVVGDAAELEQIIGAVRSAWEVACSI